MSMNLLAIETTGAFASVALLETESSGEIRCLDVIHGNDRFSHLQNLTPQIREVLEKNGRTIRDVDRVAVSHGPGSFTGIRIGVSTARALSQVLGMPCVAVSSLEALALRAWAGSEPGTLICPILDARRTQVYGAGYLLEPAADVSAEPAGVSAADISAGSAAVSAAGVSVEPAAVLAAGVPALREEVPAGSYLIKEFLEKIAGFSQVFFLGDGIDTCGELIREHRSGGFTFCGKEIRYQDAGTVALRGWQLLSEGRGVSYGELQPEYMRMAEAERKLLERQRGKK